MVCRATTLYCNRFAALARGFVHYPKYDVWRAQSAFPCAEELHAYEQALRQAAALDDALEVGLLCLVALKVGLLCGSAPDLGMLHSALFCT